MKKLFLFSIIFLLICPILVNALQNSFIALRSPDPGYELNYNDYEVTVGLKKGWNLVMGFYPDFISSDSYIKKENIKAIFMYSPDLNKYIMMYPQFELPNAGLSQSDEYYDDLANLYSYWVYSDKDGMLIYNLNHLSYEYMKNIPMKTGWNFVGVNPNMADVNVEDFAGTCNIEKVYFFNPYSQNWINVRVRGDDFESNMVGGGALIKVSNKCVLGYTVGTGVNPPRLPTN